MKNTLRIRDYTIGAGIPGIIVPIVDRTEKAILEKAEKIKAMQINMVEWRADFYDDVFNIERTVNLTSGLRTVLGEIPLLFTFRSKREGGDKEISLDAYTELNTAVAKSGKTDLIDVEIFADDEVAKKNIDAIHKAGAKIVGSYHDSFKTPSKEDIIGRLLKMQHMGVDVLKIAVMPNNAGDVLTLLSATYEMKEKHADRPMITMSTNGEGVISRLSGELFGSSMTFGAVGQISAPGQIPLEQLSPILQILHSAL